NQYHVVIGVAQEYWQSPEILDKLYLTSNSGNKVPLSSFIKKTPSQTLLQVNHQGQFPAVTFSFNLQHGFSLGTIVEEIKKKVNEIGLPSHLIQAKFQGTAKAFEESLATQPYLILGASLVVYIVLGILYESTVHPLTILSTLPSAGIGALLVLMITGLELSVMGIVGILLLVGIVKK